MSTARMSLLLLLVTLATSVHAETVDCTPITSAPHTITTQGIYCLTGKLATSQTTGHAIEIDANNVTPDLNGWKVGGQAAGTATSVYGIFSTANKITIKNGIVRGFEYGIFLSGRGAAVEGITADQNSDTGIMVYGDGARVRDNQIVDTGGSTASTDVNALGIYIKGAGSVIHGNQISGLTATGSGVEYGIYLYYSAAQSTAQGNIISDTVTPSASSVGIYINGAYEVSVSNNIVTNFSYGVDYADGASGIYARNMAGNCTYTPTRPRLRLFLSSLAPATIDREAGHETQ